MDLLSNFLDLTYGLILALVFAAFIYAAAWAFIIYYERTKND
jgi:hypothetical protein